MPRGPACLSGKEKDSQTGGAGFDPPWIPWVFQENIRGRETSEPQQSTVEDQEIHKYASCRLI